MNQLIKAFLGILQTSRYAGAKLYRTVALQEFVHPWSIWLVQYSVEVIPQICTEPWKKKSWPWI